MQRISILLLARHVATSKFGRLLVSPNLSSATGIRGVIPFDGNGSRHAVHPGDRFHSRASASRAIAKATFRSPGIKLRSRPGGPLCRSDRGDSA